MDYTLEIAELSGLGATELNVMITDKVSGKIYCGIVELCEECNKEVQ